ncbi:MAG: hypothetical protein PWQ46_564 [Methanomicrobiaceae archaeon]|nr:hypothetical protein [Methanomicrobiaceae archaeon]MDK2862854.1 hypothetical protein [Methanomicrobiaceae archaeon]
MQGLTWVNIPSKQKYIVIFVLIIFATGVTPHASAFHLEREEISVSPDSLTTRQNVFVSDLIRFEYQNGSTFPGDHLLLCSSELEGVCWTYEVIIDGDTILSETSRKPYFSIPGFDLSYGEYFGQSMKLNLTLEGRVPEEEVGTKITLLKVWQVDPTGAPLPESHYTYLKEGRIARMYTPPTPEATPTPPPTILSVDSIPRGALVFVDGRMEGVTPCTLREIGLGEHIVSLNLTGYHPWSASIDVEGGRTTSISAILQPAKEDEKTLIERIIEFITGRFSGRGETPQEGMDETGDDRD